MMQKPEKGLKPWRMGIHLRSLSKSYPMNTNMTGFQPIGFSQNLSVLVHWMKVVSALGMLSYNLNKYLGKFPWWKIIHQMSLMLFLYHATGEPISATLD